jgi:hypothetical protein
VRPDTIVTGWQAPTEQDPPQQSLPHRPQLAESVCRSAQPVGHPV